jgi:hypothetical protein
MNKKPRLVYLWVLFAISTFILIRPSIVQALSQDKDMYIQLLKEMFAEMVVKKDASLIPKYYHEDFLLYTNGHEMDYKTFLESHEKYYATDIQYTVDYDEETFVEQRNKLAARIWITTTKPNEAPKKIEVLLIAEYRENKIYRIWELTHPDWSKLPSFQ